MNDKINLQSIFQSFSLKCVTNEPTHITDLRESQIDYILTDLDSGSFTGTTISTRLPDH